jgi:hypothetical protein
MEYNSNEKAYTKCLLHSIKYSSTHVNGILLGTKTKTKIDILEAVPLFHSRLSLTPALEVALNIIEHMAHDKQMEIVGYYYTTEILELSKHTHNAILDKLRENCPGLVSWKIVNEKWPMIVTDKDVKFAKELQREDLRNMDFSQIVDFESHLEDPKLVFMN